MNPIRPRKQTLWAGPYFILQLNFKFESSCEQCLGDGIWEGKNSFVAELLPLSSLLQGAVKEHNFILRSQKGFFRGQKQLQIMAIWYFVCLKNPPNLLLYQLNVKLQSDELATIPGSCSPSACWDWPRPHAKCKFSMLIRRGRNKAAKMHAKEMKVKKNETKNESKGGKKKVKKKNRFGLKAHTDSYDCVTPIQNVEHL